MLMTTKRRTRRSAVALAAATALLVGIMASPASAVTGPEDVEINALLKGGFIDIHDYSGDPFPLGEKDEEENVCTEKNNGARSNFSASVDENGTATDFEFFFAQGSSGLKVLNDLLVCVVLEVVNDTDLKADTDDKQVVVYDETNPSNGPQIEVTIKLKNQNNGNVVNQCTTSANTGPLYGKWEESKWEDPEDPSPFPGKDPWDWQVTLANDASFNVPGVTSTGLGGLCNFLVKIGVDGALGLPSLTDVEMKWIVYEKD